MDIEKNYYYNQKIDLIFLRNICIITISHLFVSIFLFVYVSTTLWYLQQIWSTNDDTSYQMSLVTKKFSYSIRSLLLLSNLQ
ncbi:unnamed protein product [Rotaria sordida]|uniref:Uncharacterized protein n=1 Tax=Rotaria sordida TaxID=392033 RepID=A0A813TNK9_9BILA|nr:unnamed protein product [Rotaria sordida]CAF0778987.1 unnamed protein product [Rotaria sordida]CAF0810824.1 unnamed protein product [Rotaria sordida]CAF3538621.1 unnamed protein product [Rotaria sordida]